MRIAHVVRQYYPSIGGFEEVVKNLCKHQRQEGHDPYVITLDRYFKALDQKLEKAEIIDGISVIRIPFHGSTRYPIAPSVLKYIKEADIVHVHAIDFFYDFLAITKLFHQKKMVVSTHGGFFHTSYASTFKKIFFNTVTRLSALFYHKVIASSENDAEIFKAIVLDEKLTTIENGVDIEKLHVENKTEFPPALLYFGRWSENKGIFEALALFANLSEQDKENDWRFILAGRPYDLTSEDIQNKIEKLNIQTKVEIHVNPTIEQLKVLTLQATYFFSLSKFEGFGIAPIEAMSAGLTPVLSAIPPFIKLIDKAGEGVVIHEGKANQVKMIMAHYQNKHFKFVAMQQFIQQYAWSGVNQHYMDAYQ